MTSLPDNPFHQGGWHYALLLLLAVPALSGARLPARTPDEFPGLSERWHYYRSPHFEEYSAEDDWGSRDALERLELVRAVFLDTFKFKERLPLPVTIYNFDSTDDFRSYLPDSFSQNVNYIGFCASQFDRAVIFLAPSDDSRGPRPVVYHEFIHYLFRITDENPPPWYNEGVAELYSTLKDDGDTVEIGLPADGRVAELQRSELLPLDQLFGLKYDADVFKNDHHTGVFYAESWALLHYLEFGRSHLPKDRVLLFLNLASSERALADPVKLRQACRDLLGCDYPQLMDQLRRYISDGTYYWHRFPRPKIDGPKTYTRRAVEPGEMADRLAELSLRTNRSPLAKLVILKSADREPGEARLQEVLGNDALLDGDTDRARERWENARALNTTNPAVYWHLADLESRRWFESFDLYFRLPDERAAALRDLLQRSIQVAPDQSDAYEMLAWVESASHRINVANVNLVQQRFPTLKDKARTLLALTFLRVRVNDLPGARSLLGSLQKMNSDKQVRAIAGVLEDEIRRREQKSAPASDPVPTPAQ